jgi:hypothetical protein
MKLKSSLTNNKPNRTIDMHNKPNQKPVFTFIGCAVSWFLSPKSGVKTAVFWLSTLVIFLAAAGALRAQSPSYAGIYIGQTSDGLGGFALFVDANQQAVLIGGYLYNDDDGDAYYAACKVDASGNGSSGTDGVTSSFTISTNGSVSFIATPGGGSDSIQMAGSLVSNGPFLAVCGLYSGTVAGQKTPAIVAADGWIYRSSPNFGGGGRAQVTAYGQGATENSLGHTVLNYTLNLNATLTLSGSKNLILQRVDTVAPVTNTAGLSINPPNAGTISGIKNGQVLKIGRTYPVSTTANNGFLFSNWTDGDGNVLSTDAKFDYEDTDGELTANFVTNLFLGAAGAYHGLFAPTNVARGQMNSGSFRINVTSAGTVSGSLDLAGQSVSLSPQKLSLVGAATIISKRPLGKSALTTTVQLDFADQSVTGTVTDGSTFTAQLEGDRDVFNAAHKAAEFSGPYTLIIPGTNDATVGPYGVSYGTVNVSSLGAITFAGNLADGTSISQSSVVSKDGYWPLYVSLYGGRGSLWGWNLFTNQTIISAPVVSWINETNSSKTAVYRPGFTNEGATLTGQRYVPGGGLPGNFAVTLEAGNLLFTITNGVTITSSDKVVTNSVDDTNKLKLTINKTTGIISGTFANPSNPKQTIKVNGVILQGQTNAQGYFLGTNQSGVFLIQYP